MNNRLRYLYDSYIKKTATLSERQELADLLSHPSCIDEVKEWIGTEMENDEAADLITFEQAEEVFRQVLHPQADATLTPARPLQGIHYFKAVWVRYAAAIFVLVAVAVYLYIRKGHQDASLTLHTAPKNSTIVPGGNKAVLTLADGSTILLDSAANGNISRQGNTQVVKLSNGQIAYQVNGVNSKPVGYNTMATPRGGQYQLQLPDGTKVWLNASSSITYPTAFSGNERRVQIKGEVYFEVVKNPNMPFKVYMPNGTDKGNGQQIEVIGTHFNVNSYDDEPSLTITLLEGSVKVNRSVLKPGEAYSNGKISKVNTEEAVAWKNGYFQFNQADIKKVMRQISRWYDIEVSYEGNIPDRKFGGDILRDSNLSDVLEGLEVSQIHFRLSGRKLTIIP